MSEGEDIHLTISDFRPLYCVVGVRDGFREAGLDFRAFLDNGAMASELLGRGYDAVVLRVIEAKRQKESLRGQR